MGRIVILCIIVVGALFYVGFYNPRALADVQQYFTESVCDVPIPYRISTVDPQFGISTRIFQDDVAQAVDIWDQATGKQLFRYDPNAELQVALIYDKRQALTNKINSLEDTLQQENTNIQPQIADYKKSVASFEQQVKDLNDQISYWNAKGGAPKDTFDQLVQKQKDLQAEEISLNEEAKRLNLSTDNFNSQVGELNQTISSFNSSLEKKPEEGLYDPYPDTITIYFYNNHDELIHTLAHELGHARGLDHVADQNSIMYAYTTQKLTPTSADLTQLTQICQRRFISSQIQDLVLNIRKMFASFLTKR